MSRVLHVITLMNRGGLETFIMNIFRSVDHHSVIFNFLATSSKNGDYDAEIRSLGGEVYHIDSARKSNGFADKINSLLKLEAGIKKFLQTNKYDSVHIHASTAKAYLIAKGSLRAGIKNTIVHSHNSNSPRKFLHYLLKRKLNKLPIIKLACSAEAGKWMYGKKGKFQVINNGIDTKEFAFNEAIRNGIRTDLGIQDKFVIGHVGRFAEQKNHPFLIDIFNEVSKLNPNVVLMLIGRGENEEKIKAKVRDLNLSDKVIFLGVKDNISEHMQAMDLFLMPSLHEGLPVTMVEAQAAGLKCVVSDVITKEADLTGVKYISLAQTAEAWAKILLSIELKHDRRSWYEKVKTSGFDIEDTVKALEKIYTCETKFSK